MVRRAREEFKKHLDRVTNTIVPNPDGSVCHCLLGLGAVRKNRPYGSHVRCGPCARERAEKRRQKKLLRAAGRNAERA